MSFKEETVRDIKRLERKICCLNGNINDLLSEDIIAALEGANAPGAENVFLTAADLGSTIDVIANYAALPDPTAVTGDFYWAESSQGTQWLPGSLGGTYYPSGIYYSNGVSWTHIESPYQAALVTVNAGVNDNQFVTPYTLENADKWNDKADTAHTHPQSDITGLVVDLAAKGTFTLPALTTGSVLFSDGSTIAQDNTNFSWDDSNNRLGIGTNTPLKPLHIIRTDYGSSQIPGDALISVENDGSAGINIGSNTSGLGDLSFSDNQDSRGIVRYYHADDSMRFHTASNLQILIDSSGRMGVGSSSPTAGRLVVADTVLSASGSLSGSAVDITQTWNTTGVPTAVKLNVTKTAAGTNPLLMDLQRDGSARFTVRDTGETLQTGTMNATNVSISSGGLMLFSGRSYFTSPADGQIRMTTNSGSDFNRLQFGGTTSSYPSLKRSGANLQVKLADDSTFTFIEDLYRRSGTGDPEAVVAAPVGAVYHRTDGGASTSFYVKESGGATNSGWAAK